MRLLIIVVTGCLAVILSGCAGTTEKSLWNQVDDLSGQKITLKQKVEILEKENANLTEQVNTLSSMDGQVRIDLLSTLERVELSKRTGIFDKDKNGTDETLVVIVVPYDDDGDKIKAAAEVDIQLWDLNKETENKLAEWKINPADLKKRRMSMPLTGYYHLKFNIAHLVNENTKELTVKVKFTDYLTGKVFRPQHQKKP